MTDFLLMLEDRLPRLAWLAVIDRPVDVATIFHGACVEVTGRSVVEGVWAGAWDDMAFARSDSFFGSGLAAGPEGLCVSPSRALVDRVVSYEWENGFVISNSLPLLLFSTGATLEPGRSYIEETYTILKGIRDYDRVLRFRHERQGKFRQHYHQPFRVDAQGLHELEVGDPPVFGDYESYLSYLEDRVEALLANAASPGRRRPLVPRLTLSRGYDSPMVAALVSRFGAVPAYTAPRSNSLIPSWLSGEAAVDDGGPIARRFGLPVRGLLPSVGGWDERLFYAGSAGDPELIFSGLASDALADRDPTFLFTGYHGDKVWSRDPGPAYVNSELRRGDTSGLALSELRLHAGFVNVAFPFVGARGMESIVPISRSPEMDPWSVGGTYDRPIPRRAVEECGIPRDWFGQRKRAVVQTPSVPSTPRSRRAFGRWLATTCGISLARYRVLVLASLFRWAMLRVFEKALAFLGKAIREPSRWRWVPGDDPASLLHRWALSELSGSASPFPRGLRADVRAYFELGAGPVAATRRREESSPPEPDGTEADARG